MINFSPLLPCTLALILGITWESSGTAFWLPLILLGVMAAAFFARHYNYATLMALSIAFFVAGALRYEQQKNNFERFSHAACDRCCALTGTIDDIEPSYRKPDTSVVTVGICQMKDATSVVTENPGLQIKLATKQNLDHLRVGDTITCPKIFLRACPHSSYQRYVIKEQLAGHVTTASPITLLERPTWCASRWLTEQRNSVLNHARALLSPTAFTLFASIFWGKKELDTLEMDPIKDHFKKWGILHYLARSGLHVLLFVMLCIWILVWLPLPFAVKQVIMALLIIGYHLLSWPSVSFMRAFAMFLLYKICILRSLQINVLHLLALTCVGTLLINPFQLFFLDFQLSFGLTFALAWLTMIEKTSYS